MVGTGEIKYPECTRTSTAAREFDIDLSRARGRKPWPNAVKPNIGNQTEIDDSS